MFLLIRGTFRRFDILVFRDCLYFSSSRYSEIGAFQFLKQVVLYAPNIILAALIMLATIVSHFLRSLVKVSVSGANFNASKFLGTQPVGTIIFGLWRP